MNHIDTSSIIILCCCSIFCLLNRYLTAEILPTLPTSREASRKVTATSQQEDFSHALIEAAKEKASRRALPRPESSERLIALL